MYLEIRVVGDHANDIHPERANGPAIQQVIQAVAEAGDHQDDLHPLGFVVELEVHTESSSDALKAGGRGRRRPRRFR